MFSYIDCINYKIKYIEEMLKKHALTHGLGA